MYRRKNKKILILLLMILVVGISVGYAVLNSTLKINGTSSIKKNTWDVHFENIYVQEGSVTPAIEPAISDNTTISNFELTLDKPGDFYEFYVDVVNKGTIDAMIDSVVKTPDLTETQKKYINYIIEYQNGEQIAKNQLISQNSFVRIKVLVEYKKDLTASDLPTEDETLNLGLNLNIIQADNNATAIKNNGSPNEIIRVMSGNGTNTGDKICIINECFYVISSDEETITMLAEYNLEVGNMKNEDGELVPIVNPSGIQSSKTIELNEDGKLEYGTIAFSTTNYWWDNENNTVYSKYPWEFNPADNPDAEFGFINIFDNNSILYPYLENYKTYLTMQGVNINEIRLVNYPDIENLFTKMNNPNSNVDYSWAFYTSYWIGSITSLYDIIESCPTAISPYNELYPVLYDNNNEYGIRPVITLSKSELYNNDYSNKIVKIMSGIGTNLGDEVCIDEECFYVLFSDEETITMVTKYNLEVGNMKNENGEVVPIVNPSGLQSELTKQVDDDGNLTYGTIAFSESAYWLENGAYLPNYEIEYTEELNGEFSGEISFVYVYNNNSLLYPHFENYKTHLMTQGINVEEIRTLSFTDYQILTEIIDNYLSSGKIDDISYIEEMFITNFWTGSSLFGDALFALKTSGDPGVHTLGAKPVITLSKNELYK